MGLHQAVAGIAASAMLAGCLAVPAFAEDQAPPATGAAWRVEPVQAALGDGRACAATKMTGETRGVGFTRTAAGLELLTVAVQGWNYPLGKALGETIAVDGAPPKTLEAFGQGSATLAKFDASSDKALRAGKELVVSVGEAMQTFDIAGLDEALTTLAACAKEKPEMEKPDKQTPEAPKP